MSPLSTDARRVLDAARGAYDPGSSDRLRVRTALAATLPAAGAAAAGASATGALKLVVFGVSVAVGSLGVLGGAGVVRAKDPAPPRVLMAAAPRPAPVVHVEVPPEPEPEPLPALVLEEQHPPPAVAAPAPKVHRAREVAPPAAPAVPAPPPAAPRLPAPAAVAPSPCAPEAELAVVQRAQQWLHSTPGETLRQLDNFDQRCPEGVLVEERLATRAIALCLFERADEGRAALAKLEARNPSSPALTRVREACGR